MLGFPDRQVGDTWFFVDDASSPPTAHCYYLTCPKTVERHSRWSIGHATSTDLTQWQDLGAVLHSGLPDDFDGRCPATGSVLRLPEGDPRGRFVMAYTGNWAGPDPAAGLAFSEDLHAWTKSPHNPITRIDERFYERESRATGRDFPHWRDPFLVEHAGWIHHAVCASRNDGPERARGTVGLARTQNYGDWEVLPPPDVEPVVQEMECPQLRQIDGWWVLMFSAQPGWFTPEAFDRVGRPTEPGMFALVSRAFGGPYVLPDEQVLDFDRRGPTIYAGQAVHLPRGSFRGWWMLGTTEALVDSVLDDPRPLRWNLPK